jgi:hypothetical protein
VDTSTGAVVQIDFGICFGMGQSVLPVPEFIPFRLTPQLRAVLQPLDGVGLLRHYMMQCLQALRADAGTGASASACASASGRVNEATTLSGDTATAAAKSRGKGKGYSGGDQTKAESSTSAAAAATAASLSAVPESYLGIVPNALEVYLNDPVVDWLKSAAVPPVVPTTKKPAKKPSPHASCTGTAGEVGESDSEKSNHAAAASNQQREEWQQLRENMQWEPRRRVHLAVQKLRGVHPTHLLLQDLARNPAVQREKSFAALEQIVTSAGLAVSAFDAAAAVDDAAAAVGAGAVVSVGQQADTLINLATDANILVRQWGGLQTWL